jgi:hypothetical protein
MSNIYRNISDMDLRIKQANDQIVSKEKDPDPHHAILKSETECNKISQPYQEKCLDTNVVQSTVDIRIEKVLTGSVGANP